METRYYKIPPECAERMGWGASAPVHPDGWHLITPARAAQLASRMGEDSGRELTPGEAVAESGGVAYTEEEAMASQRGEAAYMMGKAADTTPEGETTDLIMGI